MKHILVAATAALLIACAATPPQSLDEGLAYVEGQVTAAEKSLVGDDGKLVAGVSAATAQKVLAIGDQALAAIAAARTAEAAGDTSTAQGKLSLASSLLAQIASFLASQGVK